MLVHSNTFHAAWLEFVSWYAGDQIQGDVAQEKRAILEALKLHSGITATSYINKFLTAFTELNRIPGEAFSILTSPIPS